MPFTPDPSFPNFLKLRAVLVNSRIQVTNKALYQVINQILEGSSQLVDTINNRLQQLIATTGAPGTGLANQNYLTHQDDSVILPNSRQLLAGTGITFDDTAANQRTINSTAVDDYVVMSDGATPTPSPVNDGFGNFIYIPYTP